METAEPNPQITELTLIQRYPMINQSFRHL